MDDAPVNPASTVATTPDTNARIVTHALDMLCIAGYDGYFKTLNPSWTRVLGWSTDELLARPWIEFVHPDDRETTANVRLELIDGRPLFQFENRYLCKDGTVTWLSWNSFPYPDERIFIGVARDITDHKRIERLREDSVRRLQQLFDNMTEGFALHEVLTDEHGAPVDYVFVEVNEAFKRLTGLTDSIIGKRATEVHPDIRDMSFDWIGVYGRVALSGEPIQFEQCFAPRDRWYSISAFCPEHGFFAVFCHDITESKQAREAVRSSERRLRKTMEVLPVGLWFADRTGTLLGGNPAGVRIWGAEPKVDTENYGVFKARRVPSGEPLKANDWALVNTIKYGTTTRDEVLEIDTFDGQKKVILNYTAPIMDDDENVDGAIIVNLDITDRMRMEQEMRVRLDELRRWHDVTLGRENRILELKREVNELLAAAGQPARYDSAKNDG